MMVEGHGVVRMRELATVGNGLGTTRALESAGSKRKSPWLENEEYIVFVIRKPGALSGR